MNARGQALVESLAATLVLIPLLFAVVHLAALQSAEQTTLGAVRAAALAAHHGLDAPGGPLSPERVRAIFFPDDGTDAEVALEAAAQAPTADQAERVSLALIAPAQLVGVGDLDFRRSRAVAARASVTAPEPLGETDPDAPKPRVSAVLPLMIDDWEAAGAAGVWRRSAALSATGLIAAWRGPLTAMVAPMRLFEPAVERLCLGRIDPDIVPEDRLRGVAKTPDLRTQPC